MNRDEFKNAVSEILVSLDSWKTNVNEKLGKLNQLIFQANDQDLTKCGTFKSDELDQFIADIREARAEDRAVELAKERLTNKGLEPEFFN